MKNELMTVFHEKMRAVEEMVRAMDVRLETLEAENTELRARLNDGWYDRVTFENVVEQIAACEDAKERDEARKIFEPMLKKEMARKLRAEIKRKVKELNDGDGSRTFNNYGTYTEVQSGGVNINE
ncbi:MAG: hypothetical protein K5899_02455 [Bacteroidaceae bacterium]|nr:hypothetical protein [Bacteroidaceae bacterium]